MQAFAYRDRFVLETAGEGFCNGILVGLLNNAGRRGEDAVGSLALSRVGSHAHLEEDLEELSPWLVCIQMISMVDLNADASTKTCTGNASTQLTVFCVLSRDLSNGIADLVPDAAVGFCGQDLEQLLADDLCLCGRQTEEDLNGVALLILTRLGRDSPKNDGGEGAELLRGHS